MRRWLGRLLCALGYHAYGPRYEMPFEWDPGVEATPTWAWTCTRPGCDWTRAYIEEVRYLPPA